MKYEGKLDKTLPEETTQIMQKYQIQYFFLLGNTQRYNLTTQQYIIIHITKSTAILRIKEEIPMMPRNTFHLLQYRQLINIATASNYLPDVVGQVVLIQGTDLQNPSVISKIVVGLLLNRSKMVRLTLMDNASSLFRDLHSKTVMKYKVVLITSINPRVLKGSD
ncbi:hypothetical protein HID58_080876 [Brassica napus]|uniref:DNA helicase n=1 Tax=Brassica napus TaxID=3708 RepID=A0ABQ7Y658_BRANA|nr:hypothetical protein HID58_080876 [Brassica napus]